MHKETSKSDSDLILSFKQTGEQHYLSTLFKRYEHLILGVCLKYLKNKDEAQDATMEIYEHLLNVLAKHDVSNFKSWLYRVCYNHCMQILRKQTRENEKFKNYQNTEALNMENDAFEHHDDEQRDLSVTFLEACLKELNEFQKNCVQLFFLQDKCYKEIETNTGYPLKKVKSYIQNGKRNLKNCIERKHAEQAR